jgi:RNA polymerase sigma-70 factor (ECF subfamily)
MPSSAKTDRGIAEGDPLPPDERATETPEPLASLYRSDSRRLLRFFARRAPAPDAPDLVHDSFVRLAAREQDVGPVIERPAAYLSRIASNLLRNLRKQNARRSAEHHAPLDEARLSIADPVHALEARDMLARIEAALALLPERTKDIYLAHRLDGYSYAEIAALTGLSIKGVEWQMSKAIAHVDRVLATFE